MSRDTEELRALIDRLARLLSTEDRLSDLNPAQARALEYLSRANRFSRAPSHVADYLGTTRGTVSQTLKALERKALVTAVPDPTDRRSVRYDLTGDGALRVERARDAEAALDALGKADRVALDRGLRAALGSLVSATGVPPFGICGLCKFHQTDGALRHCTLLDAALAAPEAAQICHVQVPA